MTQLFYNPDALPEDRIKHTFVGRQWLLDELISLIRKQPKGAGVQHVLIVAPRGMGKTTIFLMLGFAIDESDLKERWQVVRFREESYGITDAGEFWMEALRQLSLTIADHELETQMTHAAQDCHSSAELESGCLALLKEWAKKHKKRLLLLVENFDDILDQIHSDEENSRLRNVLMNDGTVMLIGASTSFFEEARGYEQPLYNFFKAYSLEGLTQDQIEDLLRRRAEMDGNQNFAESLKKNAGRIRALGHFTGGNPRLVLMLYNVIAGAQLVEVKEGLEKLLDEVTPFFKAKTEKLPAQQRKILDEIARQATRTSEGQSPTAIGLAIRMTPNQVSAQLQRMAKTGYVCAVNVSGRAAYYTLSEPLFALWYQMRFGREARERMRWLVDFLRMWYDSTELGTETERLVTRFDDLIVAGHREAAREVLAYGKFLVEAMTDPDQRSRSTIVLIARHGRAGEWNIVKQLAEEQIATGIEGPVLAWLLSCRAGALSMLGKYAEALSDVEQALRHDGTNKDMLFAKTDLLARLSRFGDALVCANELVGMEIDPSWARQIQSIRLSAFVKLDRWADAYALAEEMVQQKTTDYLFWFVRASAQVVRGELAQATSTIQQALKVCPDEGPGYTILLCDLFDILASADDLAGAEQYWHQLANRPPQSDSASILFRGLMRLARTGQRKRVTELIAGSEWHRELFPLLRALEFLDSGDRDLIEKLSPEVRGVVEDIVNQLDSPTPTVTLAKPKKAGARPRP